MSSSRGKIRTPLTKSAYLYLRNLLLKKKKKLDYFALRIDCCGRNFRNLNETVPAKLAAWGVDTIVKSSISLNFDRNKEKRVLI